MRTKAALLLLILVAPCKAVACDHHAICEHIYWCLTNPTIDPNDVKNLNWSIDVNSGVNIRFNTEKCQKSRATKDGYDHWSDDEKQCSNEEMRADGVNARKHNCGSGAPQPQPTPGQGTPEPMHWCFTCATTSPVGSPCECMGQHGTVSRHQ
jgi:hypothetical protein